MRLRRSGAAGLACLLGLTAACGGEEPPSGSDNPGGAVHGTQQQEGPYEGAALAEPYQMPDVELADTSGAPFHLVQDTTAPVTLVFFGYTHCPDVCTLVMADVTSALNRVDEDVAEDVEMVFITTDPKRDDGPTIREYLDRFDESYEGLTGPLPDIKEVAKQLGVAIEGTKKLPSGGYEVGHSSQLIGFGADDRAPVVWTQGTPVADLVSDITTLVEDQ